MQQRDTLVRLASSTRTPRAAASGASIALCSTEIHYVKLTNGLWYGDVWTPLRIANTKASIGVLALPSSCRIWCVFPLLDRAGVAKRRA